MRTPETWAGIGALERAGYMRAADADRLREAYGFLRRLELTLRMVHGARAEWIVRGAADILRTGMQHGGITQVMKTVHLCEAFGVRRELHGGGAGTYTLLLASMGAGAIASAMFLPRLRASVSRDDLVIWGTVLQAAAMAVVGFAPNPWVAAERGHIDGVIAPSETRAAVTRALRLLRTKREAQPPKKHGNIPL